MTNALKKVRYVTGVDQVGEIPEEARAVLREVQQRYVFRANDYYLKLIDWSDPDDPIRQLIIPRQEELTDWGRLDASDEMSNSPMKGVQHKYHDTVLLLCNEVCGAYCRYCFRKRLFMNDNDEVSLDVTQGLEYLRTHPEVTNVLLTGGDPLLMATRKLAHILRSLREIPHVQIIRIGSKLPAFNPWRLRDDPELQAVFRECSTPDRRIYLMAHFDHPRELTDEAVAEIDAFLKCGVIAINQCPLIRGVNDSAGVLAEMWKRLSFIGCPPYYLFQGRPTAGNEPYELPIVAGFRIYEEAKRRVSGLAKRARFCMSHATGKVEILAIDDRYIYMKYHRAKRESDVGRFFVCRRDDEAYWLDQLEVVPYLGTPAPEDETAVA